MTPMQIEPLTYLDPEHQRLCDRLLELGEDLRPRDAFERRLRPDQVRRHRAILSPTSEPRMVPPSHPTGPGSGLQREPTQARR